MFFFYFPSTTLNPQVQAFDRLTILHLRILLTVSSGVCSVIAHLCHFLVKCHTIKVPTRLLMQQRGSSFIEEVLHAVSCLSYF